jgi:hypothetical protein
LNPSVIPEGFFIVKRLLFLDLHQLYGNWLIASAPAGISAKSAKNLESTMGASYVCTAPVLTNFNQHQKLIAYDFFTSTQRSIPGNVGVTQGS